MKGEIETFSSEAFSEDKSLFIGKKSSCSQRGEESRTSKEPQEAWDRWQVPLQKRGSDWESWDILGRICSHF